MRVRRRGRRRRRLPSARPLRPGAAGPGAASRSHEVPRRHPRLAEDVVRCLPSAQSKIVAANPGSRSRVSSTWWASSTRRTRRYTSSTAGTAARSAWRGKLGPARHRAPAPRRPRSRPAPPSSDGDSPSNSPSGEGLGHEQVALAVDPAEPLALVRQREPLDVAEVAAGRPPRGRTAAERLGPSPGCAGRAPAISRSSFDARSAHRSCCLRSGTRVARMRGSALRSSSAARASASRVGAPAPAVRGDRRQLERRAAGPARSRRYRALRALPDRGRSTFATARGGALEVGRRGPEEPPVLGQDASGRPSRVDTTTARPRAGRAGSTDHVAGPQPRRAPSFVSARRRGDRRRRASSRICFARSRSRQYSAKSPRSHAIASR